jgi:Uma2 family endonuclease
MRARQVTTHFTPEQYLAIEAVSEDRHELLDGQIYAMAGGSRAHSLVCQNVGIALAGALRPHGCRVFQSDLRLFLAESASYVYPDVQVVCGEPTGPNDHAVDNPTVVVEVLSPSTADFDRGDKVVRYQRIPTARDILLVDPEKRRVEHWFRRADRWEYDGDVQGTLSLVGCEARIDLAALFLDLPAG